MIWSSLRQRFVGHLAPELRGVLDVHVTEYGRHYTRGRGARGWLTYHGVEVVSMDCTVVYAARIGNCLFGVRGLAVGPAAFMVCQLGIAEAIEHRDVAVRALALLDRRVGRHRLDAAQDRDLHPMEAVLWMVRRHARGERSEWPACPGCARPLFGSIEGSAVRENCRDWRWSRRASEAT